MRDLTDPLRVAGPGRSPLVCVPPGPDGGPGGSLEEGATSAPGSRVEESPRPAWRRREPARRRGSATHRVARRHWPRGCHLRPPRRAQGRPGGRVGTARPAAVQRLRSLARPRSPQLSWQTWSETRGTSPSDRTDSPDLAKPLRRIPVPSGKRNYRDQKAPWRGLLTNGSARREVWSVGTQPRWRFWEL